MWKLAVFLFVAIGLVQGMAAAIVVGQNTVVTRGRIIDENGQPIANRKIFIRELSDKMRSQAATSDVKGEFEVVRNEVPTLFFVVAPEGKPESSYAGITRSEASEEEVIVEVLPHISMTGQLVSADDGNPTPNTDLVYQVSYLTGGNGATMMHFEECKTDNEGKFEFKRVIVGGSAEISIVKDRDDRLKIATSWERVTRIEVMERSSFDIGKISKKKKREPITSESRAKAWLRMGFSDQLKKQKLLSKFSPQNVLVIAVPQDDDPLFVDVVEQLYNDKERRLKDFWNYRVVVLNPADRSEALKKLGIDDAKEDFSMHLLSEVGGKVLGSLHEDELESDGRLDCEKVAELLGGHKTERIDGEKLLREAYAKAASEKKEVIVTQTTRGAPCDQLLEFFSSNRQWEKDYVWVAIDHRWTDAGEIINDLRGGFGGMVPFTAIVNAEGRVLMNSVISGNWKNRDEMNVGFPQTASEKAHFKKMFLHTRTRLKDQEIDSLVEALGN